MAKQEDNFTQLIALINSLVEKQKVIDDLQKDVSSVKFQLKVIWWIFGALSTAIGILFSNIVKKLFEN